MTDFTLLAALLFAIGVSADQPGQKGRPFGPGRCGPIDLAFVKVATETGGQVFPLAPSETAQLGTVMAESSRSDSATILWAGGSGYDVEGGFAIPVDRCVQRLTLPIMFDGTGGGADVVRPNGAVVPPGSGPGDVLLNCGRIVSVDAPEP